MTRQDKITADSTPLVGNLAGAVSPAPATLSAGNRTPDTREAAATLVRKKAGVTAGETAPSNLSTCRVLRVPGEAFDADQVTLPCESCGLNEYACECEVDEPSYEDWAAPFARLATGWARVEL